MKRRWLATALPYNLFLGGLSAGINFFVAGLGRAKLSLCVLTAPPPPLGRKQVGRRESATRGSPQLPLKKCRWVYPQGRGWALGSVLRRSTFVLVILIDWLYV